MGMYNTNTGGLLVFSFTCAISSSLLIRVNIDEIVAQSHIDKYSIEAVVDLGSGELMNKRPQYKVLYRELICTIP